MFQFRACFSWDQEQDFRRRACLYSFLNQNSLIWKDSNTPDSNTEWLRRGSGSETLPSWEGVQRAGSLMQRKQTVIRNTLPSLCTPLPSLFSHPLATHYPQSLWWGSAQHRRRVSAWWFLHQVAVPLESCIVGPAQAALWLWPLFSHGLLFPPPPTWSFFLLCWCFLSFPKYIFHKGATNLADWLAQRYHQLGWCAQMWPVVGPMELSGRGCAQHSSHLPTDLSPIAPSTNLPIMLNTQMYEILQLHDFPVPWERWCSEGEKLGRLVLWLLSQAPGSAGEMVQSWREAGWVHVVVPAMLCHPSRGSWVGHGFPWALFCSLSSPEVAEMVLHSWAGSWVLPPQSLFSHLQLPQYLSMSLVTGLVREYLIDDCTICFLICCCCFPIFASVTSGRFCTPWWSIDHLHSLVICVLEHSKTNYPPRDGALAGKGLGPCYTSAQAYWPVPCLRMSSSFYPLSSVFFHTCSPQPNSVFPFPCLWSFP